MTKEYVDTMIRIVTEHACQQRLADVIKKRVLDLTARNTSHIAEFRSKAWLDVTLTENGKDLGVLSAQIYYDPDDNSDLSLELDGETARLAEIYFKRQETIGTLNTILGDPEQHKSDVIRLLPCLKPLFDRTDAVIRESKAKTEERRRTTIAELKAFFSRHSVEEEDEEDETA